MHKKYFKFHFKLYLNRLKKGTVYKILKEEANTYKKHKKEYILFLDYLIKKKNMSDFFYLSPVRKISVFNITGKF